MLQAFDVLERLDPTQQMYEAKRGAAVGAFQMVVAGKEEVRLQLLHVSLGLPCCPASNARHTTAPAADTHALMPQMRPLTPC